VKLFFIGLTLGAVALAQKVTVEFDRAADFTHYKTFAIRAARSTAQADPQ